MQDILYNIFLYPFEYLFYFVLNNSLSFVSPGIALIILSIVINAIYIPISIYAKKIEVKEREKQKLIKEEVKEVKKQYKGEEAFRKIEAIYKKHNFSIFLSFRANLSLLVMIPFFIAAVMTLNENQVFSNESFLIINDLSKQDGILFGINLLPFLMTIINIISIKYICPEKPLFSKDNSLLIILALLFLVYLYNKSSALLLYWTCNNLIFLIRILVGNRIEKLRNK